MLHPNTRRFRRKGRCDDILLLMRRFVDLHTHSTASDGAFPPAEVIRLAEAQQLAAVALTDHDTAAGLAEARVAAGEFPQLCFVPGIELSAKFSPGTLHIIGLGINDQAPALRRLTRQLVDARNDRNPRIIARLQEMGLAIEMDDVLAVVSPGAGRWGGEIVGRVHIAEALRQKGQVRTTQEAFDRYIGNGGLAYVDKERLGPAEVISAIHEAGGLAALAHPMQLQCDNSAQLERVAGDLKAAGLDGIEVYHSDHSHTKTRLYMDLAKRLKLEVGGGSDFHGHVKPNVRLGRPSVPISALGKTVSQRLLGSR